MSFNITDATAGQPLPKEFAATVNKLAAEESLVARLSGRTPLTLGGKTIPVYNGGIEAGVVAEGQAKPVSKPSTGVKYLVPHKVATIVIVSDELVRENPGNMLDHIQSDLGAAIGRALDQMVLHGKDAKSGAPIANQTGVTATSNRIELVGGDYKTAILAAHDAVDPEYDVNAIAFDKRVRSAVLQTAQDVQYGLPDLAANSVMVAGFPTQFARTVGRTAGAENSIKGIVGDWSQLQYGFAQDIVLKRSTEASVVDSEGNTVNLWQNNLVGLLVEATMGGIVLDENAFSVIADETV